jgi:glycosyltransferase involved in cell wall biosynthesis
MKKSVLLLTNAYPDFKDSYRGIFIKKMAQLLQKDGYQIFVVTPKIYRGSRYFEDQNGISVYRFPFFARDKLLIEHQGIPYLKMILYYISGLFLTFYVMLKHQCILFHAHWAIPTGLIGALVGNLLKKPLIVTIHGSDLRRALENLGWLRKIFIYVCKSANHLNCVSRIQKEELERLGFASEKISIIPMGVDEAFLESGKSRKTKLGNRPFTILSNRNLLPNYNVSLLIRAIPMVVKEEPNTIFLIAGDGPERENLEREVRNLNTSSSVKFLGRIPHEEMPNLLGKSDIYISTSLCDGTSVSLLEAMGSGAFPVATDIPANREWIVDGENGFLFPIDKEVFLANRILDAIRNRELVERSRMENFLVVKERALWPVNIDRFKELYSHFSSKVA